MEDGKMRRGRVVGIGLVIIGLAFSFAVSVKAQNFKEAEDLWKTETLRAKSNDSVLIERHSFFSLPAVSDTTALVYHEPMPDSVMPRTTIEIGQITIQESSPEEVILQLEKQARKQGADWIVSFNEPRVKFTKDHEAYYRSQAMLYKVINSDLIPESNIADINCDESHLKTCEAIQDYVKHIVAKGGE
jgi:hypothetical protein